MSDPTIQIERIVRKHCVLAYPPSDGEDQMVRAITVLVAVREAKARRNALEEAERAIQPREMIGPPGARAGTRPLTIAEQIAAIRALAEKEKPDA